MEEQLSIFEVVIKRNMGTGNVDVGVREVLTFHFVDIGDITFSKRLVERFEHGMGEHKKGFDIVSVKNLGEVSKTDDWKAWQLPEDDS